MDDTCEACGFTVADYSTRDLATAPRWLTVMLDEMLAPIDEGFTRPAGVAGPLDGVRSAIDALGSLDGAEPDASVIHDGVHGLRDLGRALHAAGAGAPTQQGTVVQLSTSDGGVPKSAVPSVDVGPRGLLGDRQADRKHHGRPFQALCLWSADVIDALVAERHPVRPGAAGENVTIGGVDWVTIRPGVRILLGEVLCEVSAWAEPCRKNDQWFTDRSDRIDQRLHPGWSRAYAWVLEPGIVTTGDDALVEP